ncbi:MAG: nuclear transport factor 2 family protein [Bacteroidota bacterium]|nr:nuclear transport factor 2 family protein [Ferruginibacter sp.]
MRNLLVLFAITFSTVLVKAQTENDKLVSTIKGFHQSLVAKNITSINQQTDKALSYGHSNGWVETKTELMKNLESGSMKYESYIEDSLVISLNGNVANARFSAGISATKDGKNNLFQLYVLEVWVKKGNRWLLFARQAVKKQ